MLKFRHNKQLQYELTRESLEAKKATLEELEQSEIEARKLDQALDRALSRVRPADENSIAAGSLDDASSNEQPSSNTAIRDSLVHTSASATSSPNPSTLSSSTMRKSASVGSKFGFLGALSNTLNGMVDADPDMTRRNSIGKTRDSITQLENSIQFITLDLRYANQMIQADLDRFQRQKVTDIREMCTASTNFHKEWCSKNLDMWREARKLIDEIDVAPAPLQERQ